MSIRRFTTHAVDCDGPGCHDVFADTCEQSEDQIIDAAERHGWSSPGNRHYCPKCWPKVWPPAEILAREA